MSRESGYEGNETIKTITVDGIGVDIVGCFYKDTPEDEFDFYDLYADGECINLGEPFHKLPTEDDIRPFLELKEALEND